MDENIIGLLLAITSSILIGASFVITKKGLVSTRNKRNAAGRPDVDNHTYLKNVIWWIGMATMVCGEIANFAAYSFAPAVLVTPLGALSVLIGAVLANFLLNEKLGKVGICGCALCLIGSVMIVLHAPADQAIESVDSIVTMVLQPAFIVYSAFVLIFSLVMIFKISPRFGKKNMLVYVSICSFVGSITVLSSKGFGIALKLTFQGNNQLAHPGTWIFAFCLIVCAIVQVNYFNRALGCFSTNLVTPIYYVFFTTATIAASAILFQGFHESSVVNVISLFCGFLTIFVGVFLLNTENPSKIAKVLQDEVVAIRECDLEKGSPTESATGHQPPESSSLDSLDRPMTSLSRNRDTEMHVNDLRPLSP